MDTQMFVNALLLAPAALLGIVAVRARRQGRTTLGLGLRDGAIGDAVRGAGFGAAMVGLVFVIFVVTGLSVVQGVSWDPLPLLGITAYFLVLFVVEEIVFRALLMTGLGVLAGQLTALTISSVLVAVPYAFATGSGVVPVVGAVLTNLVNGLARWRTGRIWFGVGMRTVWNSAQVGLGFAVSGYQLGTPVVRQQLEGPMLVTGGSYGPEGGLIGIGVRILMLVLLATLVSSRVGPWTVRRQA